MNKIQVTRTTCENITKNNNQAITCEANLTAEQYEIEEPVWESQSKNTLKIIHILYGTTNKQRRQARSQNSKHKNKTGYTLSRFIIECNDYITSEFNGSSQNIILNRFLVAHNLNSPAIFQLSINPQHCRGHVNAHSLVINFTNGLKLIGDHYSVVWHISPVVTFKSMYWQVFTTWLLTFSLSA